MLRAFYSFLFLLGTTAAAQAQPDDIIRIANGVLDSTQHSTLGLTPAPGTETITIFHPTDSDDHYANGVVMTAFKDALYCMWQSSAQDEDSPDTWVACSRSCDNGQTWTKPQPLAVANDTAYCTSGGWIASGDTLVAFVNVWPKHLSPTGGYTYYSTSTNGTTWSNLQSVTMVDGSPMNGVIEQDPTTISWGASSVQPTFSQAFTSVPYIPTIPTERAAGTKASCQRKTAATNRANWSPASISVATARSS